MQHAVSGKLDGGLQHGRNPVHKALTATGVVLAALVISWIIYLAMVAGFILLG